MDRFEKKLDKVQEDIGAIKIIMARNTVSLEEHMKRTALAEQNIQLIQNEMEPIKDHVKFVNKFMKVMSAIFVGLVALKELGVFQIIRDLLTIK